MIHIINNYKCNCGASFEDVIHYFLECPLYLNERRTLLSHCDDININIETLLFGNDDYSYDVNSTIFGKVRTFINQSKKILELSQQCFTCTSYFLLISVKMLHVCCLCFVLLSLIHVYNL